MTDTITCPNCSAQLPAAASFCTSCGNSLAAPPAETAPTPAPPAEIEAPPEPPADATRVDNPGIHDATQVYTPPPAPTGPWEPAPSIAPVTQQHSPTAPPADQAWGQPSAPAAPPQPLAPPPGAWGQPTPPPAASAPPTWQTPTDAAHSPSASTAGSPIGAILAILGGILAIAGTFSVWITNNQTDAGLSGWDLTSGDKGFNAGGRLMTLDSPDPYIIVALGVVALVIGALLFLGALRTMVRIAAVVVGVAIIGLLARDWTSLASVVSDNAPSDFEISAAAGFYLVGAGGVLTALAALLPAKNNN